MKILVKIIIFTIFVSGCSFGKKHLGTWMIDPKVSNWELKSSPACFGCPDNDILANNEIRVIVDFANPLKNYREYVCIDARFLTDSSEFEFNPTKVEITRNNKKVPFEMRHCLNPESLQLSAFEEGIFQIARVGELRGGSNIRDSFSFYIDDDPFAYNRFKIKLNGLTKNGEPYDIPELTIVYDEKTKIRPAE